MAADLPEAMLNNNSPTTLNLAGHGNCLGDGQEQEEEGGGGGGEAQTSAII